MEAYAVILAVVLGMTWGWSLARGLHRRRRDRAQAAERARALELETRLLELRLATLRVA